MPTFCQVENKKEKSLKPVYVGLLTSILFERTVYITVYITVADDCLCMKLTVLLFNKF